MMQKVVAVLLLATCALGLDTFQSNPIGVFLRGRDTCISSLKIAPDVADQFRNFIFPADSGAEEFMLCQHRDMGLWQPDTGFDLAAIKAGFVTMKRDYLITPNLKTCNLNDAHLPEGKWIYNALKCMYDSAAGRFFQGIIYAFEAKLCTSAL